MNMNILNKISSLMLDEDVFYMSYGKLTQNILQSVVATTKNGVYDNNDNKDYSDSQIDSLVAIAIEMIQNVSKYRKEIENYNNDLILITTNQSITINTSNLASRQNKENISTKIDFLNSLDKDGLRKHAREAMKKARNKDENSAGLGLIEISRLTTEQIKYEFIPYKGSADLFHFNLSVVV